MPRIEATSDSFSKLPSMDALEDQLSGEDTVLPSTPKRLSMEDHERRLLDIEEVLDRDLKKLRTTRLVVAATEGLLKKLRDIGLKNDEVEVLENVLDQWNEGA